MKAVGKRIIIRIDKAKQTERRNYITTVTDETTGKASKIHRAIDQINYAYNLQYGEVLSIGAPIKHIFPEVAVGDILIFHHFVEHKPTAQGDANYYNPYLLGTEENGDELLNVQCFEDHEEMSNHVFGVFKPEEGVIIPYKDTVFCHAEYQEAQFYKTATGLNIFTSYQEDIPEKLTELKSQIDNIRTSAEYAKLQLFSAIDVTTLPKELRDGHEKGLYKIGQQVRESEEKVAALNTERKRLSEIMRSSHFYEFTAMFVSKTTSELWGIDVVMGDKIIAVKEESYPLDFAGMNYNLISAAEVAMVKKGENYCPLFDYVLIKSDEALEKTAGGLFIPEMSIQKANTGTVVSAGASCYITPGYRVRFTSANHIPITIAGVEYLLMREGKLINSFGVA